MSDETEGDGLRDRITRSGEDAIGRLAQDLLENPLVSGAISRVFDAREKAVAAQESAMGALNLPSAADIERLTRRVRSLAQRMEGIEDGVDRVDERIGGMPSSDAIEKRLAGIEDLLDKLTKELAAIRKALPAATKQPRAKAPAK